MRLYLKDLVSAHADNNIYDDIKIAVCERVQNAMYDLSRTLNFALDEDNLGSFDEMLDCRRIEEIQY